MVRYIADKLVKPIADTLVRHIADKLVRHVAEDLVSPVADRLVSPIAEGLVSSSRVLFEGRGEEKVYHVGYPLGVGLSLTSSIRPSLLSVSDTGTAMILLHSSRTCV